MPNTLPNSGFKLRRNYHRDASLPANTNRLLPGQLKGPGLWAALLIKPFRRMVIWGKLDLNGLWGIDLSEINQDAFRIGPLTGTVGLLASTGG